MVRLKAYHTALACGKLASFNSLMVRLKVSATFLRRPAIHRFNSLMVRLKVKYDGYEGDLLTLFQFLDGAIKSDDLAPLAGVHLCFNSLMVRLKGCKINS